MYKKQNLDAQKNFEKLTKNLEIASEIYSIDDILWN